MGRIDYGLWFWRVVVSDLPLLFLVWSLPGALEVLLPNDPNAVLQVAIWAPLAAFLLRGFAGRRQIRQNHLSRFVQAGQFLALVIGIVALMLIDFTMVLMHRMGNNLADSAQFYLLLSPIYLVPMAIAMYPGRTPVADPADGFYPDA